MQHSRRVKQGCMDAWVEATDAARLEIQLEALTIRINHLESELHLEREQRWAQSEAARERQLCVARQVADRLRALRSAQLKLGAFTCWAEVPVDGSSTNSADADTAEPQGRNPAVAIPPLPLSDVSAFGAFRAHRELSPPSNRSSHSDLSFSASSESSRSFYLNLSSAASTTFSALQQALGSARSERRSNRGPDREDVPSARHNPHMGAYDMTHDSDTMMLQHNEGAGVATTGLPIRSTSAAMATASARRAAAKGAAAAEAVRAAREAKAGGPGGPARQLVFTPDDARADVATPISLFEAGLSPRRPRSRAASPAAPAAFHALRAPTVPHCDESDCGFKAFEGILC
jgi:hypothetical protein